MITIHLYFYVPGNNTFPLRHTHFCSFEYLFTNFKCKRWQSTYMYTYIAYKTPVIWHLGKNLSCTWTKMKTMENVISIKYFLPHQLQQHIKLEGNALPFYPEFFHRWINICSPLYHVRKIDIAELYYSPLYLKKRPVFENAKMKSIVGLNLIMEKC